MSTKRWTDFQQFLEQFEPDSIYPGEISEPNIFDKHGYGGESRPSSPVSVKSKPGFGEWKPPAGEDKPKGFSEPFSNPDISPALGYFDELLSKLDNIKRNSSVSQVGPQPESPVAPSPILRRPDSNEPGVSANRNYSGFDVEQYNKLQDVIAESGRGKDLGWFTNTQPFNPALISGMATEIKDPIHKKMFETLGYKNYNNPVTVSSVGITAAEIPELSNFENLLTRLEEEKQRAMNEHQKQLAGGGHQGPGPRPGRPGPRPGRPPMRGPDQRIINRPSPNPRTINTKTPV